jgi:hypothetical protein
MIMETMKIKTIDEGMQMSVIASVAFEANRQYCEMIGGKAFNPSWTEVSQDVRNTLLEAVKVALTDKIISAELSHLRWMNVRIEQGWTKGPRYDPYRKIHPNLVGFKELPVQEQLKDILFLAIVNSLGAALGYRAFDDDGLSAEDIQEHEEIVADLETAATGKTESYFVPAGEGDGKSIGEGPEKPEKPDEEDPDRRLKGYVAGEEGYEPPSDEFSDRSAEFEKDRVAEPTPPLPGEEGDGTKQAADPKPNLPDEPDQVIKGVDKTYKPVMDGVTTPDGAPISGVDPGNPPPDEVKKDKWDEKFEKGKVSEPTQAPEPAASGTLDKSKPLPEQELPTADPVDHKATEEKTADRLSKAVKKAQKK